MIKIQESKSPWEISHIHWLTSLLSGGDRSFNASLVLVYRYSKAPTLLPFHKGKTALEKAIMIWNRDLAIQAYSKTSYVIEIPNLLQLYGQISIILLVKTYHSQLPITLRLMDCQKG
ncbi:hypothetical protein O181_000269 [Austropuccinia psidii MF-1]|uniref:Uncharacterized protein n=1 Tax=Austropuccinia psidii MF-1 TaxID=1389203 RepID=A0A9Q3GAR9_9BASI|nr:hypothetical protein [Austropuccinia psidii MF-1]